MSLEVGYRYILLHQWRYLVLTSLTDSNNQCALYFKPRSSGKI